MNEFAHSFASVACLHVGLALALACGASESVPSEARQATRQAPPSSPRSPTPEPGSVNGCLDADWVDHRASDVVEIVFGGHAGHNYVPRCVIVAGGTALRFLGPFETHPFVGGRVAKGLPVASSGANRFAPVAAGDGAEFRIEEPGEYGYYCDLHVVEGMAGAVRVVAR